MLESFSHGEGVEITSTFLAVLQDAAQVMACDFHRQRIGDDVPGLLLVLSPSGMCQSDPDRTAVDEELDVYGVGVAGCDRHDDALINTTDRVAGPTLNGTEVFIHRAKLYPGYVKLATACRNNVKYGPVNVPQNKKDGIGFLRRAGFRVPGWGDGIGYNQRRDD